MHSHSAPPVSARLCTTAARRSSAHPGPRQMSHAGPCADEEVPAGPWAQNYCVCLPLIIVGN